MSEGSPERTFDRREVDALLQEAARIDDARSSDHAIVSLPRVGDDGLTLAEIERAAGEVGISRAAVSIASLLLNLRASLRGTARAQLTHEIPGELGDDERDRLTGDIRTLVSPSIIRATPDGLDVEIGKGGGEPGSLLVQIRSKRGSTTISMWSSAPAMSTGDVASLASLGVPAFLFPVVATSGGNWPALAAAAGLAVAGLATGTGIALAAKRWRLERWNDRVERAVMSIAASVSAQSRERVAGPVSEEP